MSSTFQPLPVALSIAGSDCSAGAGIQADLKSFTRFRVYGLTAVTCVVSEIPGKVSRILACDADLVSDQVRLLLAGFPVAAAKTGMLFNADIIEVVAQHWEGLPKGKRPHLVVDPVMVATSGDALVAEDAVEAYRTRLFPLASLLTPNLDEAAVLLGRKIPAEGDLEPAAQELMERFGCAILLKGGHLKGKRAVDVLCEPGRPVVRLVADFIPGFSTHGTGCTYSAAITAQLALGKPLVAACRSAKRFVTSSIAQGARWGKGKNAVDALRHW